MPLKINFNGIGSSGHNGARSIGPIVSAQLFNENGSDVIVGDAILWKNEFPEEDLYLREATAENKTISTSWEILFADSKVQNGIEWLNDVIFAGSCIVKDPAYGNRTRILSVAEKTESELMEEEKLTEQIGKLQSDLYTMISALDELYWRASDVEEAERTQTTVENVGDRMQKIMNTLKEKEDMYLMMSEKASSAEIKNTELETQVQTVSNQKAEAETKYTLLARRYALAKSGIQYNDEVWAEKSLYIIAMSEDVFNHYLNDITNIKPATASTQSIQIPEPIGNTILNTKTLAHELNSRKR